MQFERQSLCEVTKRVMSGNDQKPFVAEELQELQKKEKEMNVQPDWEIDAFTKAQIRTGKRHSIVTDLILKLLGLDVSPEPSKFCPNLHNEPQALAHIQLCWVLYWVSMSQQLGNLPQICVTYLIKFFQHPSSGEKVHNYKEVYSRKQPVLACTGVC